MCRGPPVRLMNREPTGQTIVQEPRLVPVMTAVALGGRAKVEESTGLARMGVTTLPRGGRRDAHPRHAVGVTIAAIAIVTDVGMTGVTSRTPRRLADLQLATAAEMVKENAVGTMGATEVTAVTAVAVGEMTHPQTGKNPGGWQVPQSSSALEGRD